MLGPTPLQSQMMGEYSFTITATNHLGSADLPRSGIVARLGGGSAPSETPAAAETNAAAESTPASAWSQPASRRRAYAVASPDLNGSRGIKHPINGAGKRYTTVLSAAVLLLLGVVTLSRRRLG